MKKDIAAEDRNAFADKLFEFLHEWYDDADRSNGNGAPSKAVAKSESREIAASAGISGISFRELANSVYQARRLRDKIFSCTDMFGEPAWDMLLDIATAESDNSRLSVTAVCIGSCVAPTTALRYIKSLEEAELICREEDRSDGRRQYIRLTRKGDRLLRRYFYQTFGPHDQTASGLGAEHVKRLDS